MMQQKQQFEEINAYNISEKQLQQLKAFQTKIVNELSS